MLLHLLPKAIQSRCVLHVSSSPHMLRTHAVMVSRERRGPNAASDADCRSKISWWTQDRPEQNPVLTEVTFPYHVWYIYPHLSKNTPNEGKLIPSMDPKGFWFSVLFFFMLLRRIVRDCRCSIGFPCLFILTDLTVPIWSNWSLCRFEVICLTQLPRSQGFP